MPIPLPLIAYFVVLLLLVIMVVAFRR